MLMDKELPRILAILKSLQPWHLLALGVLSGVICLFALRANNEHMVQLRSALYQADQNNTNVQKALHTLQQYVTSHMNTDLSTGNGSVYPPIQLVGTYDRLVQAQDASIQQQNSQIYTDAQAYCEKLYPTGLSGPRIPCIDQYVTSKGLKAPPAIPDSLYKFDFVSPTWSPDLAGWSMVVAVAGLLGAGALFIVRLVRKHR